MLFTVLIGYPVLPYYLVNLLHLVLIDFMLVLLIASTYHLVVFDLCFIKYKYNLISLLILSH